MRTSELKDVHQTLYWISRFPMNQWWRFAVDGKLQAKENGWKAFDKREPGSVNAILHGIAHAIKHLRKPITLDLIKELHVKCGTNVRLETPIKLGDFNNDGTYVQILPEVSTPQALHEFLHHHPKHNIQGVFLITEEIGTTPEKIQGRTAKITVSHSTPLNHYTAAECPHCAGKIQESEKFLNKEWRIVYYPPHSYPPELNENVARIVSKKHCPDEYSLKTIEQNLQDVLDTYTQEQKDLPTPQERAQSGIITTQEAVRLHPFKDLMNRVIVNCLFFLMELKNGFMPPLHYDPNCFEFTHLEALLHFCNRGQQLTNHLIDHPDANIFGVSVTDSNIDPALQSGTQAISFALQDELYNAGHQYRNNEPTLALQLYQRALELFEQSGSPIIKNHVAFLYAVGLCHKKLNDTDALNKTIGELQTLADKQPKPKPSDSTLFQNDQFDPKAYIESFIKKLLPQTPQKQFG